ncbi:hypothetical protein DB354_10940 [Opitutus sp. ER46]|nr:hypothetical protein DB354_10940 [Opitutus sp. ER46]
MGPLLGYLALWFCISLFILLLAKRKGRSPWVAVFGFVPVVNVFYAVWLASQPDRALIDRLVELERRAFFGHVPDEARRTNPQMPPVAETPRAVFRDR